MKLLLDTHTFLWFINDDPNLTAFATQCIDDADNDILVSLASLWEIDIKLSQGKLRLAGAFETFLSDQLTMNGFTLLDIRYDHLAFVVLMPFHHKDPLDRLLIAQAMVERVPIISRDAQFDAYGVQRLC